MSIKIRSENSLLLTEVILLKEKLKAKEEQLAKANEALRFYGNPASWLCDSDWGSQQVAIISCDQYQLNKMDTGDGFKISKGGKTARQYLTKWGVE